MNEKQLRLSVLYIKLDFCLLFGEDTVLPREKVSALRGGMGEMILRQNCVSDRKCEECIFEEPCLVRHLVYTRMKKKPDFMQGDDSIGYLIECEDYQTEVRAGDRIHFRLTLFGNNIVYFSQYLQAFFQLGVQGIGKRKAKYQILEIRNMAGEPILEKGKIRMENFCAEYLYDYVNRRKKELMQQRCEKKLVFYTPLTLKYRGTLLREFHGEAVLAAIFRRLMMLDYFSEIYLDMPEPENTLEIADQEVWQASVQRFSTTQKAKMSLNGIRGVMYLEEIPEDCLDYILAGELLHIGKNSSFGFGRYRLE